MVSSADILAAFREVTNVKQMERSELYGLLQDGCLLYTSPSPRDS